MKKNMPLLLIILIFGNMLSACNDNKIPVTAEIDKAVANAIITENKGSYGAVSYTHLTLPTNREV